MNVQLSFHCTAATAALIVAKLADVQTAASRQVAQAHFTEGLLYLHLEQWPRAMACYQKAIPAFRAAQDWLGLGQTCLPPGHPNAATLRLSRRPPLGQSGRSQCRQGQPPQFFP